MSSSRLQRALQSAGKPIVVATHPRSGTHLTIDLLRRQFPICRSWKFPGERLRSLYLKLDALLPGHPNQISESQALRYLGRVGRPVIKTHALPDLELWSGELSPWREWLQDEADFLYVVRDGRDVICSYHQLMMTLRGPRSRCNVSEFMRQHETDFVPGQIPSMSRVALWAHHLERWLATPDLSVLRFDEIIAEPAAALEQLSAIVGVPARFLSPVLPVAFRTVWQNRRARFFSVNSPGTGVLGLGKCRWREEFTPDDHEFFQQEAGDALQAFV